MPEKETLIRWLLPWLTPIIGTIIVFVGGYILSMGKATSDREWIKSTLIDIKARVDSLDEKIDKQIVTSEIVKIEIQEISNRIEELEK